MKSSLDSYRKTKNADEVKHRLNEIAENNAELYTSENLIKCFGFIDLTTLNTTDSESRVIDLCRKINDFQKQYPHIPNVAGICVFPNFVDTAKANLKIGTAGIACVSGGFPSAQTFLDVKTAEIRKAAEMGATDIDVVLQVGYFLDGHTQKCADELKTLKSACGKTNMRVILETGALVTPENIWNACLLAMDAGADFIKTSSGKYNPSATLEAALVVSEAIKEYYTKTGRRVGFIAAGGITTGYQAIDYYSIIENVLGNEWLNSKYFRIGANSLANKILEELKEIETGEEEDVKYF